jgi:uncharacterized cupredoxin-like copper-binding protein
MRFFLSASVPLLLGAVPLGAQAATKAPARPAQPPATAAPTVAYVRVVGTDYAFEAPEATRAGIVTFNLVNNGSDLHQMAVYELPANHTLKEFLDQYHAQGLIPGWMTGLGQTTVIAPQAETFLTIRMKPGRYLLLCPIPARDGRMHTEKGMVRLLTVR